VPARKIVYPRSFRPSNAPAEVQRSRIDQMPVTGALYFWRPNLPFDTVDVKGACQMTRQRVFV